MKIKAAVVYKKSGRFNIEEVDLSEPRHDELIIRMVGSGICHTDLAARAGYMPVPNPPSVFGHEGSGVVEKVGKQVTKVKKGDHVVICWDACGTCSSCRIGNPMNCLNLFQYNFNGARPDGSITITKDEKEIHGNFFNQSSFATHALVNERNVIKVREDVPLEMLGPLCCGIITGAGTVMHALHPEPGSSIAIFGAGTVGLSGVMGAAVTGCTPIIAIDKQEMSLDMAKEMGATHTINVNDTDPVEAIKEITGGGAQYTMECVGSPLLLRNAVDSLARLGVCAQLGVVAPGTEVVLDMDLLMNGRTVRGITGGEAIPELFIPKMIDLYMEGRFPFDKLIKYYQFEEINKAVEDMEARKVLKPILRFS